GEAFSRALGLGRATREDLYPHHLVGRGHPCCEGPRTLGGRNLFRAAGCDNPSMSRRNKNCRSVGAWRILRDGYDDPFHARAFLRSSFFATPARARWLCPSSTST